MLKITCIDVAGISLVVVSPEDGKRSRVRLLWTNKMCLCYRKQKTLLSGVMVAMAMGGVMFAKRTPQARGTGAGTFCGSIDEQSTFFHIIGNESRY